MRVETLAISRGGRTLFENLSFAAAPGGYVEIRGANGAGKTSLLRALAGFLRPSAGAIMFDNADEPALAVHYIAHANALKPNASVGAHVRYWSGLFGAGGNADVLDQLGLSNVAEHPARTLSQGQARRLALSRLLIAPRPVWLLDEPAAALDAQGHALVDDLIAAQRERGGIVLAALHEPLGAVPGHTITLGQA